MGASSYRIGEAAEASGNTVKAIHHYEQIGLIPKACRGNGVARTGGNRLYSEADVGRLCFVHHARLLDMSLPDIRELLAIADEMGCPNRQPEYREILMRHLDEIDDRIQHLLGLRESIEDLLAPKQQSQNETTIQQCSWGTCKCMQPSSASSEGSADHKRKRGGSHL